MADREIVDAFKKAYRDEYQQLLATVKQACESLQKGVCKGAIANVYGRLDDGFKDSAKIAAKIRERGKPITASSCLELNDVVGLTIVAQYNDQIDDIVKELKKKLRPAITLSPPEQHRNKGGYYATHVICEKGTAGEKIKCEIQIKTMLHNAWAAKMHDLTYKPAGILDPRLSSLMASIAATIESLEAQSVLVRDLITASWDVEAEAREQVRKQFFDGMLEFAGGVWRGKLSPELGAIYDEIEAKADVLIKAEESKVKKLLEQVHNVCEDPGTVRYGWVLAGRLAVKRNRTETRRSFTRYADTWLHTAGQKLNELNPKEISAVPMMFYVLGDIDLAIEYSQRILQDTKFSGLPQSTRLQIEFNEATFLTEREYHAPTKSKKIRANLRRSVEDAVKKQLVDDGKDIKSAVDDTLGLIKITFGETKEEIKEGIDQCIGAIKSAAPNEAEVSSAYMELNTRLGWRRYFEIEAMTNARSARQKVTGR